MKNLKLETAHIYIDSCEDLMPDEGKVNAVLWLSDYNHEVLFNRAVFDPTIKESYEEIKDWYEPTAYANIDIDGNITVDLSAWVDEGDYTEHHDASDIPLTGVEKAYIYKEFEEIAGYKEQTVEEMVIIQELEIARQRLNAPFTGSVYCQGCRDSFEKEKEVANNLEKVIEYLKTKDFS